MKILILGINILLVINATISQTWGDTLFVGLKSGIELFHSPNEYARSNYHLSFNEKVIVRDLGQLDTINYRIANWIYVETPESKSGWIFSGFANHKPLPTEEFSSLRSIANHLSEGAPSYTFRDTIKSANEMDIKYIYGGGNENYFLISESVWENGRTEIDLYRWELHEIINLIGLATWNEKNVEYDELIRTANPNNLNHFEWVNGFDDPEERMMIEKRYPQGVRIVIDGLY